MIKERRRKEKKKIEILQAIYVLTLNLRYFRKMYSPVHENRSLRCFQNQDLRSIKEIFQRYTKANETPF